MNEGIKYWYEGFKNTDCPRALWSVLGHEGTKVDLWGRRRKKVLTTTAGGQVLWLAAENNTSTVTLEDLFLSPPLSCSALWWKQLHHWLYWSTGESNEDNINIINWTWIRTEQHKSTLLQTSSCVWPRVRRFRQVIGTSLISTSATTRSSLAFAGTGGFPILTTWERKKKIF